MWSYHCPLLTKWYKSVSFFFSVFIYQQYGVIESKSLLKNVITFPWYLKARYIIALCKANHASIFLYTVQAWTNNSCPCKVWGSPSWDHYCSSLVVDLQSWLYFQSSNIGSIYFLILKFDGPETANPSSWGRKKKEVSKKMKCSI